MSVAGTSRRPPGPNDQVASHLQGSIWELIDAVLVINLDHRTDRWETIQQHLQDIVPSEKIHRISAVLGKRIAGYGQGHWFARTDRPETWAGRAGCTLSHRTAMKYALEQGWQRILILEDDARFVATISATTWQPITEFLLEHGGEFGVLYLGFDSPQKPARTLCETSEGRYLYQIHGASTTHAYIVNRPTMQQLVNRFPGSEDEVWPWIARHLVIDRWYSLHLWKWTRIAAVSPQIVIQDVSLSDITQRTGDYLVDPNHDIVVPLLSHTVPWKWRRFWHRATWTLQMVKQKSKACLRMLRGF